MAFFPAPVRPRSLYYSGSVIDLLPISGFEEAA